MRLSILFLWFNQSIKLYILDSSIILIYPIHYSVFLLVVSVSFMLWYAPKKKVQITDITWEQCKKLDEGNKMRLECNCCRNKYWCSVIRMKNHLARTRNEVTPHSQFLEMSKISFLKIFGGLKDDMTECLSEKMC